MLNLLTKSFFDISLFFKLKYVTILLSRYNVDYEYAMLKWLTLFIWIHKDDWFK